MKLSKLIDHLEALAPPAYQECYDNSGLITGSPQMEVSRALICLDSLEIVVDEAIAKDCDLIIAHHPIVFKGLKSLTGKSYVERVIIKCIKHDIALYSIHTNLDNVRNGVNEEIADRLGLLDRQILMPKKGLLQKIETYVPPAALESVAEAMWSAGGGTIGKYEQCSFRTAGLGTFLPLDGARPAIGEVGARNTEEEVKLEMILPAHISSTVIRALIAAHPYESVAHQLIPLDNTNQEVGSGLLGRLSAPMDTMDFLTSLKDSMEVGCIRHTRITSPKVHRIAVLGGSGSFGIGPALRAGADVLVTADVKYHEFFDAEDQLVIASIGHYESEHYTSHRLQRFLAEKLPNFAVLLTEHNTNPVNYL